MAEPRSSDAESSTVTQSFVPSKLSARPYRPEFVREAPEIVPWLPQPDESVTVDPLVSPKPYAATGPCTGSNVAVYVVGVAGATIVWDCAPPSDQLEKT